MNENKDKKMKTSTILVLGLVFGGILGSILILIDSLFVILLFLVMIPLSLYYPAKNFQKGKKLSDVRASLLETQMAEIKFFWYFITIIVTILLVALCICKISCIMKCKCILTYESFNCFLYYFYNDILFSAILVILVAIYIFGPYIKIKWIFYENGFGYFLQFLEWKDFKSYKKDNDKIILVANINNIWENFWKFNHFFTDKHGKIENIVKKYLNIDKNEK